MYSKSIQSLAVRKHSQNILGPCLKGTGEIRTPKRTHAHQFQLHLQLGSKKAATAILRQYSTLQTWRNGNKPLYRRSTFIATVTRGALQWNRYIPRKITTPPLPKRTFTKNNARIVLFSNFEAALSIFYCMHEKSKKLIFSKLEIRPLEQITQSSLLILHKQPILFCFPSQ